MQLTQAKLENATITCLLLWGNEDEIRPILLTDPNRCIRLHDNRWSIQEGSLGNRIKQFAREGLTPALLLCLTTTDRGVRLESDTAPLPRPEAERAHLLSIALGITLDEALDGVDRTPLLLAHPVVANTTVSVEDLEGIRCLVRALVALCPEQRLAGTPPEGFRPNPPFGRN